MVLNPKLYFNKINFFLNKMLQALSVSSAGAYIPLMITPTVCVTLLKTSLTRSVPKSSSLGMLSFLHIPSYLHLRQILVYLFFSLFVAGALRTTGCVMLWIYTALYNGNMAA